MVMELSKSGFHIGTIIRNSKNVIFAVSYPSSLLVFPGSLLEQPEHIYSFHDEPDDIRCLFIDSEDNIYISLKGFKHGAYGRTYRSDNNGKSFTLVIDRCCWSMAEDSKGNIFAGVYHERRDPDGVCSVLWSHDHGLHFVDISDPSWKEQTHVHHIAINRENNWLYANLGDIRGMKGGWRSKNYSTECNMAASAASFVLSLQDAYPASEETANLTCVLSCGFQIKVRSISDGLLTLQAPLPRTVYEKEPVLLVDWVHKFSNADDSMQFIGVVFHSDCIWLGNDTPPRVIPSEQRVVVYETYDDGSRETVTPQPLLTADKTYGWGCFFLTRDSQQNVWAGLRPLTGKGAVWRWSASSTFWQLMAESPQEELAYWRKSHTFRDVSAQQIYAEAETAYVPCNFGLRVLPTL